MRLTPSSILVLSFASLVGCAVASSEDVGASAAAISEGPTYQQTIDTVVNPYCQSHGQFGTFAGVGDVPIAYGKWEVANEKGAVVLLPGRTEPFLKYCELVYGLKDSGYSVYAMDHRGQGQSGRMLPDPEKQHVNDFNDYVTDVETFVDRFVSAKPHAKKYLLAHSMGSAIGTAYLEKHDCTFDAAVLSSPMYQINTAPYAEWEAYLLSGLYEVIFKGNDYVMGRGPYDPNETFETNTVTRSRDRWTMNHRLWLAHPEVQLGGPTNKWIHEAVGADMAMRGNAGSIKTPVLMFQAGADQIVVTSAQDTVCSKAAHCTKMVYPGAQHEILQETDDVRNDAISAALAFMAAH